MIEAYAATLVGVALAQASPGPNLLAVAGMALGHGRRLAIVTVLGVAMAMLVWAVAVASGLGTLLAIYLSLLAATKLVGGAYLAFLGAKALLSARRGKRAAIAAETRPVTTFGAWRRGFLVVLTNPKAALMWAAVGTYLFGSGLSAAQVAGFGPVGAVSGFLIYGTYALLFSTGTASRAYARFSRVVDAAMGAVFGLLGARLLIDGMREIRA